MKWNIYISTEIYLVCCIFESVNDFTTLKRMFIFKVSNKNTSFLQKYIYFCGSFRKSLTFNEKNVAQFL